MKRSLLLASIALFLCFCQSGTEVPAGIIGKEKLRDILVDIHMTEGALKSNFIIGDSAKKIAPALYDVVYQTHGVTEKEFHQSMDWYFAHPELLEEVQKKVVEELMLKEK